MADIKVVIQLQDTVEDIIEKLGSSTKVNNASIQKTSGSFGYLSTKSDGINMKSWAKQTYKNDEYVGSLSLADGYVGGANTKLIEQYGYNGYVFGAVPESKQLTVTLEVRGENIDSIIIYGDKNANQFPTKAYRDGDPNDIIYSDDATWAIKFDSPLGSHSITFLEWNRANYNACITYIAELKNKLYLDKSWVKSVESLSQSTGQPKEIYYGVVPSSGNIEILDVEGEIYDYINDGIIESSNLPLSIWVGDSLCYSHIIKDSEYNNKIFPIQNTDILNSWFNFKIKPYVRNANADTLMGYFKNTMTLDFGFTTEYVEEMCSNIIRDNKTAQEIMQLIKIPYQYHKCTNLLDFINAICNVCQFCIFCDNKGIPKFVNGNPSLETDTILSIPTRHQYSVPERDVIVKNKIKNIRYIERSFEENIKDICGRTFYLRDSNENWDISSLDNGKVVKIGTTNYLCFFLECSDSNSEFITSSGVTYTFADNVKSDGAERTGKGYILELDETYTKENYNFSNLQGNCCELKKYRTLNSKTFALSVELPSDYATKTKEVSVAIVQKCVSIINTEKLYNSETSNVHEFKNSDFISKQTQYNYTQDIYAYNISQIINNYKHGVSVAKITIGCEDIYDINGNKIKDWSLGHVVEVGDVVRVDKNNNGNSLWSYKDGSPMYWKVTGRNFRKVGVPMIDLELQEVRMV